MLKSTKYLICLTALLLPLTLWGQQTGIWAGGKIRQTAEKLSAELPFAIVAYDFAERYLTMLQEMEPEERASRLIRDDVEILQGDLSLIKLIDEHTTLELAEKDKHYRIAFLNGSSPLIDIVFPASCQLLTGKRLGELEQEFIDGLSSYQYQPTKEVPLNERMAALHEDSLFLYEGDSYYMKEINQHLYARRVNGQIEPFFDGARQIESVCNLLQSEKVAGRTVLDMTVRKYGLRKEQKSCPLRNWMAYVRAAGCLLYTGIERVDSEKIYATVFVVNKALNYNHVMNVEIPRSVFTTKEEERQISGDITLFVPMHNVAALFGELENNK